MAPFWHLFWLLEFWYLAISAAIEHGEVITTSTVHLFNNQSATKQHEDECSSFICPGDGLFGDPCDCRNYYDCYSKFARQYRCPEGELWSQQLKVRCHEPGCKTDLYIPCGHMYCRAKACCSYDYGGSLVWHPEGCTECNAKCQIPSCDEACDWKGNVECTVDHSLIKSNQDTDVQRAEGTTECTNGREFVSVCYYSNWAYWREGSGQYTVDDIDLDMCTHLVYAFAVLDGTSLTIKAHDSWLDLPSGLDNYNKFTNLKNLKPGIKTTLAIGGWTDSHVGSKYSTLVSSATNRQNFIDHVIPFLKSYKFDGLDLDWEYPDSGNKVNFGLFVKELKTAFEPEGLLLTAAVGASEARATTSYDIPTLSQYLDYIHLMTYDFHGSWESSADHHSKLYNDAGSLDADSTVKNWIASGASAGKLVLGVPLYGRSFTLSTSQKNPPAPASGGGTAGSITEEEGYLGYLEICTYISNGWTVVKDSSGARGPYAHSGNQWVGYDDVDMVRTKAQYVKSEDLGGTMVWAIDLTDFDGVCPLGRYPLLSAMKSELQTSTNCGSTEGPVTQGPVTTEQPNTLQPSCSSQFVCTTDGHWADPCDCQKYYQCYPGGFNHYSCPGGTLWSQELLVCDWEQNVDCKVNPVATVEPTNGPVTEKPVTQGPQITTEEGCSNTKDFVSVCYYSNWAYYREGSGQYTVDNIDLDVCTHLVYAFAVLDGTSLTIKAHDSWVDLPDGLDNYNKFTNLKNLKPGIKTSLAIGGWTDSHEGTKYSDLVSSATNRQKFIDHVIPFLKNYRFDGLDLDWEYPDSGNKANFGLFVKELKTAFEPEGLLLTAAVGASEARATTSYDIPTLSQYLDYIHLMTYDFHGSWESSADHHSKLYNDAGSLDADSTVKNWIASGASAGKLVLGVPLYGRSFTLSTSQKNPPAPASGGGTAGSITEEEGYLGYLEICAYISNGWTVVKDDSGARGPYAYSGNQWVGYDDVDMVRTKAQYVKSEGLGGTMVWAIDLADFNGVCSLERYPLLTAMRSELGTSTDCGTTPSTVTEGPVITGQPQTSVSTTQKPVTQGPVVTEQPETVASTAGTTEGECSNAKEYVSVCYYSNWAYYRSGSGKYTVDDIDLDMCTHLVYAFAVLDGTSLTIKAHDSWLDLPSGLDNYNKFTNLKNLKPRIKATLAIGGWSDSQDGTKYSDLVSSATNRQKFIDHVIPFLKSYRFDGLDLDWEYPDLGNKANFGLFVKELKTAFEPEGLLLTAAVGASEARATTSYDIPTLSQYLDYIHLMTYDFHGSWESSADHHSKLYNDVGSLDADSTVKNWIASGASAGKLVLGVPLYGRSFTLSTSQKNPPAPASGGGTAGSITKEEGYLGYLEICTYISNGWTVVKDSSGARGPYAYSGNQWIGYDDVDMVRTKAQYVKSEGLGGTMVWAIDLTDFDGVCPLGRYPLLSAMKSELQTSTNCGSTESPVTQGPVTTEQPNTLQPSCSSQFVCTTDGHWADPCDCQKYYQCYPGGFNHYSCPGGTLWSQELLVCDWEQNVDCKVNPVATVEPTNGPVTEKPVTQGPQITTEEGCSNTKDFVSVCYYSNWAYYREGSGQYTVDNIDLDVCTHLVYAFAVLDGTSLTIKAHDSWVDLPDGLDNYNKFTNLKNLKPGIKTSLAIGGWTDSHEGTKYSDLVSSATNRQKFIDHVIPFLKNYRFDGLDLDWEYPDSGNKANFGLFVKELKTAFEPEGLLLTAAVGASEARATTSYDIPTLSQYLDYIHLMTYDFHGSWESSADHHSKLYNDAGSLDADSTVKNWIASGASAGKLVLGVPLYGRSFTLSTSQKNPPAPASGGGTAGSITEEEGYLGYLEICTYISNGWTVVKDDSGARGPYVYSGNQWVGYDDVDMVRTKAQYVKSEGLGGTMVWAIDLADFNGVCSLERYPLLTAMRSELGTSTDCGTTPSTVTEGPVITGQPQTSVSTTQKPVTQGPVVTEQPETVASTAGTTEGECSNAKEYVSVCYYSNWAYYRSGSGKYTVDDIDLDMCTHLVYAFAVLDGTSLTIKAHDSWLDLPSGLDNYNKFTNLKNLKPRIKATLAIGGWTDSQDGTKYSDLVSSATNRQKFIDHVIPFLKSYRFDGLDLDWEYPDLGNKANFGLFVKELKTAFEPEGLLLTAAVGASEARATTSYDIPTLSQYLDYIHLMTYDFHGSWESSADHHSKLYNDAGSLDADSTVKNWIASGASAGKLVLGVPLYGRSFTLSTSQKNPPAPASGGGTAGSITKEEGYLGYLEICTYISNGWTVVKDSSGARGPYAYSGNQWIGYDDVDMVRTKAQYVKSEGLGGTMVWAIDLTDFDGVCPLGRYPLLSAMKSELQTSTNCGSTESPVTQGPVTTEQPNTLQPSCSSQFVCTTDGHWADPCDCQKYYQCYPGGFNHYSCPGGTLWSQELLVCDWEQNVDCKVNPVATVEPTNGPVTEKPVTQGPEITTEEGCSNTKDFVSVCYYSNWAYYREGSGQYTVDNIDLDVCTHLVYAFAVLDGTSLTIKAHDSWVDLPDGLDNYNKFTNLKNLKPGIKTSLGIGGWTDSHEGTKYSDLVSSATNRQKFIDHVIPFLKNYRFDGLDLDWEYPDSGNKANFGLFVKELKTAFEPEGLLLTAAVGASEARATTSYDIPTLSQYLDYIHLMTYDFHGSWESSADHHSKLYNDAGSLDADSTVKNWIARGASAGKLVLGVPLYGRSFTLSTSQKNPPAPASGGGTAGSITEEEGYLGYLEICTYISNGWTVVKDDSGARGPYAYSGNQWVGYDDVDMVRTKAQYVKSEGLGGTMVWAIDLADFNGVCSLERYPLLTAMRSELGTSTDCGTTPSTVTEGPVITGQPQTSVSTTQKPVTQGPVVTEQPETVASTAGTTEGECSNAKEYVSVCYYSNWAYYRSGSGKYTVDDIDLDMCTHLVYAFAVLDGTSLTIKAHDSWLDLPSGLDNYNKFTNLKNLKPRIKTTLAIGGWTDSQDGTKYSDLVSSATNRQKFIDHVIPFLKSYRFDGLDLDWEYPDLGNKANFGLFVKELKTAFEPEGLLLTAAVGASEARATTSYDIPTLSQYLDYIHLMTYDFHGSWESSADHHSKLYNDAGSLDADSTVKNWIASGASAGKLVLGVPLYGRSFTLSTSQKNPPAPASGGGTAGSITKEEGYLGYLEICTYISNGWTVVKDSSGARGPYAYSGNQWVGYDDVDMVRTKAQYVKSEGLGGTMVWAIDLTDFDGVCPLGRYPLLSAMKSELQTSTNCGSTESPVTQGPVTTEQPNTLQPSCSSQFVCTTDGHWADPCDCQKYYQCYPGGFNHYSCPGGTLWSQELLVCDWEQNVDCKVNPVATVEPTNGPVTEKPVTQGPQITTEEGCINTKDFVSVCYYSNWAYYREGSGQYTVDDIDLDVCTHLVYAFAVLDGTSLTIKAHDSWLDLPSGLDNYNKFTNLKNLKPGIKTTLAIGGWTDSHEDTKYSDLVSSATNRQKFIDHVIPFLKNYRFDGLDLDWEYPDSGNKANFGLFVKELKTAFEPEGLLLSAAVGASEARATTSYDIPTLSQYLDYIHLMTYDFHGSWESSADHHSKLYNDAGSLDADSTVKNWIASGASAGKLVLGVPLYGRSFTLSTSQKNPPAPASGGGTAGSITEEGGYLGYLEICTYISNGWTVVKDSSGARGPYAYSGNQWVGYDDVDMVRTKAQYVKSEGLGGTMVWAIDLADFNGVCPLGRYPLLNAMRAKLQTSTNCRTTESPVTQGPVTTESPVTTDSPVTQGPVTTESPVTQGPVTTEKPNTLQPSCSSQFACPGDGFWADPCDCQKYYQCYTGGVYHQSCPEGTLWNQEFKYCDWPYNVECNTGGPMVTEKSTTEQPFPTTEPECAYTFVCPEDGLWADPCDCQKYYQCSHGNGYQYSCGEGTLWFQTIKNCNWASHCNKASLPVCEGYATYVCSSATDTVYMMCSDGSTATFKCPINLAWSSSAMNCVPFSDPTAGC